MIKQIIENKKTQTKKDIYRITHPLDAIKEKIKYAKHVVFGNYDSYPPSAQAVLNKYGNEKISKIMLHRNPLSKAITTLMSGWTKGETEARLKQQPKDTLYHISMWITLTNGRVIKVEKNAVINLQANPTKPKEQQTSQDVPQPKNLTFGEMLERTRKQVGNRKFFSYSAKSNNCGHFIEMVLKANGLNTQATHDYIGQNTQEILAGFPKLRRLMNTVTDIGARFETVTQQDNNLPTEKYKANFQQVEPKPEAEPIEVQPDAVENEVIGEGLKSKRTNKWILFVKQVQKEKGITYKEAMVEAKKTYKK